MSDYNFVVGKKLAVVLIVALGALAFPAAATSAMQGGPSDCRRGVIIEGRCVTVDGQPTECDGAACVEFVEASTMDCPGDAFPVEDACLVTVAALQRDPACPEGARGEAGDCFIYRGIGPDGCFPRTTLDETGNCRQEVADAQGTFYCAEPTAQLAGIACEYAVEPEPSPCQAGSSRFDNACWQLNGLTPPETCSGHGVEDTTELASGQCRVPVAIQFGQAACTEGAVYRTGPSFLLGAGQDLEPQGPFLAGCVDDSASVGHGITHCVFLDDDFPWGDYGDGGQCTRFAEPVAVVCPTSYSFDDSAGGTCWRFEPQTDGVCPAGSVATGEFWCARFAEFAVFECPVGTVRRGTAPICNAFRDFQGAVSCGGAPTGALQVRSSAPDAAFGYSCFAYLGPQPGVCNGRGTIDDCYEIREPAAATCDAGSGCVSLGDFRIIGDVSCDGEPTLLDALLVAQFAEFATGYSDSCVELAGGLLGYDGDINNDGLLDNADTLLLLECGVGVDAFDGCSPSE